MCGITGYIDLKNPTSGNDLKPMMDSLTHRGPDAEGEFHEENIHLGHRRLSIIDLSEEANQPMHSQCNRYVIVYNGEVYNFKEIGKELEVNLRTNSDTEVVLESFAKWGSECLHKFNGMFAFAIWDKEKKELFLARDRIGIKPLYYYEDEERFYFASELKSIKSVCKDLRIDKTAINEFLHLGYIPQPHSIYEEVRKFPSGNHGTFKDSNLMLKPYWKLEEKISNDVLKDENEAKKKLNELLYDSVQKRMISDVPMGTFLSGGIDSSAVTAMAQKVSKEPVKTFSIGFKEGGFDESLWAKKVADHLGTDHHEFILSEKDVLDLVNDIIPTYDEPYGDSSALPTMLV
ncbi:MAG: asparagine synthase (glutamine-hydrolyzing), partial [Flavobacteriales bacterium]